MRDGRAGSAVLDYAACLIFTVDDRRYALPLADVERIVRAVAVKPVPNSPAHVLGLIDVEGSVLPVIDTRQLFGLRSRGVRASDRFIIARAREQRVAFAVDTVAGILAPDEREFVGVSDILPGLDIEGVVQDTAGAVMLVDAAQLLRPPGSTRGLSHD